jgi:hypothetical protein
MKLAIVFGLSLFAALSGQAMAKTCQVSANQKQWGCKCMSDDYLYCPSPGTGLCWQKGHDPRLNQKPRAIEPSRGQCTREP